MTNFTINNDFNDFEFLINSESTDKLGDITKHWFKKNLLFATIETVTISKLHGIGTTQYISNKNLEIIKNKIHKEYLEIIESLNGKNFGSPSQYYDWYKRDKFYYVIGENKNAEPTTGTTLNSLIIEPEENSNAEEYIKDYDKVLTDGEIRNFLTEYTNCFESKEWFNELPHFFILVKPISNYDKETKQYIPLGNFYIKIGTIHKVDVEEYKRFVNHLKSVWFNIFGYKILKEYSEKIIRDKFKHDK